MRDRLAGLLVPLFSAPSSESWGIGEFSDIPALARWALRAGFGMLQMLPLNEMDRHEYSPYSPLATMAFDPQFISLRDVEDFIAIGGAAALDDEACRDLDRARSAPAVDYPSVRAVKEQALRRSFDRFLETEWRSRSHRAQQLEQYRRDQSWWIDAYALYRAIRLSGHGRSWRAWPQGLRDGERDALEVARVELAREIFYGQYVQWLAESQWQAARRAAAPVAIFGDLPFLATIDSADVWMRQDEFLLAARAGAPPDDFSATGQDWGLPPCNWEVMAARGDTWFRQRARRMSALFDGYRVDHVVGFYRTYVWPAVGPAYFLPAEQSDQLAQGERLMRIFLDSGARITAEDLGTVPPFVRASIGRLGLAGYRVLRWEREWDRPGSPFRDPASYPRTSVATTGTHDTEPLAEWWESTSSEEHLTLLAFAGADASGPPGVERRVLDVTTRDRLLELLYASGSDLLVLPVQDLFGWRDRVNLPGTVSGSNWTFRLRWAVDRLESEPEPCRRAADVRAMAERHARI